LIHVDIWRPFSVQSINGSSFFLTIVDDFSRFTWVYLLQSKAQVRNLLQFFYTFVKTQFQLKIKAIRSDHGAEFCMSEFYSSKGILHQLSYVKTPQQNSVVKRKHQHLLKVARALRFQSQLPLKFWGDCVLTSVHIINRIPTPNLSNKSPYELLFSKLPSYIHLKVFGCLCFSSTLTRNRSKFHARAKPCVFIGYPSNSKGYKLYDLTTHSVFVSWDVVFHKHIFPFASQLTKFNYDGCFVVPTPISDTSISITNSDSTPSNSNSTYSSLNHIRDSVVRYFTRVRHRPGYLQHHYNLATQSTHLVRSTSSISGIQHDISSVIDYTHLSPSYKHFSCFVSSHIEPKSFFQAIKNPQWRDAMVAEISALEANNTWVVTDLHPNKNLIGCKWVYKVKLKTNGEVERYKARLVAKGYTQCEGLDYYDTFSSVAKLTTVRCILALTAVKNWHLHQLDVNNAILHGDLVEEIYMKLPLGFASSGPYKVCKLQKSFYGLKQASRQWFAKFYSTLISHGFTQLKAEYSLFTRTQASSFIALLVYVNDIVIASDNVAAVSELTQFLDSVFSLKDLSPLKFFLGIEVARWP
jgi:hypothetical protein